jgi:hypothetical protein
MACCFVTHSTALILAHKHSYFGAYEAIKRSLAPKGKDAGELNLLHVLTAGGLAGMAMVSAIDKP